MANAPAPSDISEGAPGGIRVRLRHREPWRLVCLLWTTIPTALLGWALLAQRQPARTDVIGAFLDDAFTLGTVALVPLAALILLSHARIAVPAAAVAAAIGVSTSTAVLRAGFRGLPDYHGVLLAFAVLLACGTALYTTVRRSPRTRIAKLQAVAVAAAGGLVIPGLQFWNSTVFLAQRVEISLNQQITVDDVTQRGEHKAAAVKYTLSNATDVRVLVLISALYACSAPEGVALTTGAAPTTGPEGKCTRLIANPVGDRSWIAPRSQLTFSQGVEWPIDEPLLRIRARTVVARGDRLVEVGTSAEQHLPDRGTCRGILAVKVLENSRYNDLAEQDKYLIYFSRPDGRRNYTFASETDKSSCPEGEQARELGRRYGVIENETVWEGWPSVPAG